MYTSEIRKGKRKGGVREVEWKEGRVGGGEGKSEHDIKGN